MPASHLLSKQRTDSAHARRRRPRRACAGRKSLSAPSAPAMNVGCRLRALRHEHGLSTRALASKSGLAVNTLNLIENGKCSPSVGTLQLIARALDVPITAFFETETPTTRVAHIKGSTCPRATFSHGTLEDLGAGLSPRTVQPFVVTLEPHAGSGPHPIVHTGYEFVYCLQGRMVYTIEERTYLLEPGDSLLFESYLPHHWENVDAEPARAILVLYPTDARDRPTERHFAVDG